MSDLASNTVTKHIPGVMMNKKDMRINISRIGTI
jgi:hypothetical protein